MENLTAIAGYMTGIESVTTTVTDDATAIPTASAVVNYVANTNISGTILNSIYPVGAIYQTTTTDPDTLFGTSGKWELVKTESGIKTYRRIG